MRAADGPAVGKDHRNAIPGALSRGRPRPAEHRHATPPEHVLDHNGGIHVLMRQHPVPRGDESDLGAERLVGAGELRAGHSGADHDKLCGQLVQVIKLPAGEQPVSVRNRAGQHPGLGTRRDQHDVRVDLAIPRRHGARAGQPPSTADDLDPFGSQAGRHVARLCPGQCLDSGVEPRGVDCGRGSGPGVPGHGAVAGRSAGTRQAQKDSEAS